MFFYLFYRLGELVVRELTSSTEVPGFRLLVGEQPIGELSWALSQSDVN